MAVFSRNGGDASYAVPSGAELRSHGITALMRYLTDQGAGNKGITIAEVHDLGAHGVAFGLVWELGSRAALAGYAQGVADARRAQHNLELLAKQKGGPSARRPIYGAVDFDATAAELPAVRDYFRGFASVIGKNRTGVYGSGLVIDTVFAAGYASFGWWVKAATAWGGGHVPNPDHVHVEQVENGVTIGSGLIDRDLMRSSGNWGQLGVVLAKPAPKKTAGPAKPDPHVVSTVRPGDTLSSIAARNHASLALVERLNPQIPDFDRIYPGEKVRVK